MKFRLLTLIIILTSPVIAKEANNDQLYLLDLSVKNCKILQVTPKSVIYKTDANKKNSILRNKVFKIIYFDGTEVIINTLPKTKTEKYNKTKTTINKNSEDTLLLYKAKQTPILLPIPIKFSLSKIYGFTAIEINDNKNNIIASGNAQLNQYTFKASYEPIETNFYISPNIGYFKREIIVKDLSVNIEDQNISQSNFLSGTITDPNTGEEITKNSVTSLSYDAYFNTFFGDVKVGYYLVSNTKYMNFIFNPYLSLNIMELRQSKFTFDFQGKKEEYKTGFSDHYFNSGSIGMELGLFFPQIRTGFMVGYERRYFRQIETPEEIPFNSVYYDNEAGLYRTKEYYASSSNITSDLFSFEIFYIF